MDISEDRARNQDALAIVALRVIGSIFDGAAEVMAQASQGEAGVVSMDLNFDGDTMQLLKRTAGLVARIMADGHGPSTEPLNLGFWEALDHEADDAMLLRMAAESQQYNELFRLMGENPPSDN